MYRSLRDRAVGRDYVSHAVLVLLFMAALFIFMTIREILTQKIGRYSPQERGPPFTEIGGHSHAPLSHSKKTKVINHLRPLVSDKCKVLFSKVLEILQVINIFTEPHKTGIYPREYISRDVVIGFRNDLRKVLRQNPLLFIIIGTVLPYLDEVVFLVSGSEFPAYWHITLN